MDNEQKIEEKDENLSDDMIKDVFLKSTQSDIYKSVPIIAAKSSKKRTFRDLTPKEIEELEKKEKISKNRSIAGKKSSEVKEVIKQGGEDLKIAPIQPLRVVEKVKSHQKRVEEELEKKKKAFRNLQTVKLYENNCQHMDKVKYVTSDGAVITCCEKCSREKRWDPRVWQEYHRLMKPKL